MKRFSFWIGIIALAAAALLLTAAPALAEGETLTIKGDGVAKEITYSRADLEALKGVAEQHYYSLSNNYPTEKVEYAYGIPLLYLLSQAGLKDEARLITVTAADGYKREFTVQELLYAPRYYFPATGEKRPVPAMVCLKSGADGAGSLVAGDMRLIMGQRARGEQNNPWFVKYLATIEVSCAKPAQWPEITFDRVSGPEGVTLQLLHENPDSIKMYYTTDGSSPTVESKMYNISASYFQPQLNQPLLLNKTTVVRAVAIGAGKENSPVASITVSFDGAMFSDLAGYDWAKPAIEALAAQGILSGVGDGRFDPAGNLTRGMFVTMLGRTLNKGKPAAPPAATARRFADVDYNSWYGSHIQWAVDEGIVSGYPDGAFKPANPLTVEEMIVMAMRAGRMTSTAAVTISGVSEWAKPFVAIAENNHLLVRGYLSQESASGIRVDGQKKASRAEAAALLYQLLQILNLIP